MEITKVPLSNYAHNHYIRGERKLILQFGKSILNSTKLRHFLSQYLHNIHGRETKGVGQLP